MQGTKLLQRYQRLKLVGCKTGTTWLFWNSVKVFSLINANKDEIKKHLQVGLGAKCQKGGLKDFVPLQDQKDRSTLHLGPPTSVKLTVYLMSPGSLLQLLKYSHRDVASSRARVNLMRNMPPLGSYPALMNDSSGIRHGKAGPCLPLSFWCIHQWVTANTYSLILYNAYRWFLTLSVTIHLNDRVSTSPLGKKEEKEGRYNDEIHQLSPDRMGTRPLIALDIMWMTSQNTGHRFITCNSLLFHQQVNQW